MARLSGSFGLVRESPKSSAFWTTRRWALFGSGAAQDHSTTIRARRDARDCAGRGTRRAHQPERVDLNSSALPVWVVLRRQLFPSRVLRQRRARLPRSTKRRRRREDEIGQVASPRPRYIWSPTSSARGVAHAGRERRTRRRDLDPPRRVRLRAIAEALIEQVEVDARQGQAQERGPRGA